MMDHYNDKHPTDSSDHIILSEQPWQTKPDFARLNNNFGKQCIIAKLELFSNIF